MDTDNALDLSNQLIRELVARLQRRLRVQRAVTGLVEGSCLALLVVAVAVVAIRTGWAPPQWAPVIVVASMIAVAGAAIRAFRPIEIIDAARLIDTSHGLDDRLSTAVSLTRHRPTGVSDDFARAQIRDAARHVDDVDIRRAAPWSPPADIRLFAALTVAVAALTVAPMPDHHQPLDEPFTVEHRPALDDAMLTFERQRLQQLRDGTDDDQTRELLDDIDELLDAVEQRRISPRQFVRALDELQDRADAYGSIDDIADPLTDAAGAHGDSPRSSGYDELSDAIDAIADGDFDTAADDLERLTQQLRDEPPAEDRARQLADALQEFSQQLDSRRDNLLYDPDDQPGSGDEPDTPDEQLDGEQPDRDRTLERLSQQFEDAADDLRDGDAPDPPSEEPEAPPTPQQPDPSPQQQDPDQPHPQQDTPDHQPPQQQRADDDQRPGEAGGQPPQPQPGADDGRPDYRDHLDDAANQLRDLDRQRQQQQQRQQARDQLDDMRRSMSRGDTDRSAESMEDYLNRAGGGDRERIGDQESGDERSGDGETALQKQDGDPGGASADGEGEKEPVRPNFDYQDVQLEGTDGEIGPTHSQIIEAAAEEGFATTDYEDVYVEYEDVAEEMIEREELPDGYRYHIERYFELIQPQR